MLRWTPRLIKRPLALSLVLIIFFLIFYHSRSATTFKDANTDGLDNTQLQDLAPVAVDTKNDAAEKADAKQDADAGQKDLEPVPGELPKLTPEMIAQAETEKEFADDEFSDTASRMAFKDAKHSQGFIKHAQDAFDLFKDSSASKLPLLYNRLRHGKISSSFFETQSNDNNNDEEEEEEQRSYKIPIDYTFKNPITEMRKLPINSRVNNKDYPKIQVPKSGPIEKRYASVRKMFIENWKQYFYFAKNYDSFKPMTLTGENDYIGWSLTLIDSLDTLFLMGFFEEFQMALAKIDNIDFYKIVRDDVPVFETNIRVLGGLIGAYELSQDERLMDKALDVAHILIRSFDTVNNLPMMYYNVLTEQETRVKYPSMINYLSEVGSLSLEFTRLSILTKDMKYFTYSQNLLDAILDSKDSFLIKGLIPNELDLSGCEEVLLPDQIDKADIKARNAVKVLLTYDFNDDNEIAYCIPAANSASATNGAAKVKATNSKIQVFSFEGKSDSFYEYLLKLHHLLNGNLEDKYLDFFTTAKEKIKKFLIFRPKLPGNEKKGEEEYLFLNEITVSSSSDDESKSLYLKQHNRVSHLSCFAGGFFTLSNRIFRDESDLEIGTKLTKSCYNIANNMVGGEAGGVFPESFMVDSCDVLEKCKYSVDERISFIAEHTSKKKDAAAAAAVATTARLKDPIIDDAGFSYHLSASTKLPYSPYDPATKTWRTGEAANQPLEFNDIDPRYLLRPELIESLFIQFRITGDELYREQAWEMFGKIVSMTNFDVETSKESETVQATLRDITDPKHPIAINELESWWFSETLKYFYLIFQDSKVLSLDEWVFNTQGHAFKKQKYWK